MCRAGHGIHFSCFLINLIFEFYIFFEYSSENGNTFHETEERFILSLHFFPLSWETGLLFGFGLKMSGFKVSAYFHVLLVNFD